MRNDPEQDRNHRRRRQVSGNDKPPHATTIVEAFTNGQTLSMTANRAFGLSSGSAVAMTAIHHFPCERLCCVGGHYATAACQHEVDCATNRYLASTYASMMETESGIARWSGVNERACATALPACNTCSGNGSYFSTETRLPGSAPNRLSSSSSSAFVPGIPVGIVQLQAIVPENLV